MDYLSYLVLEIFQFVKRFLAKVLKDGLVLDGV